MVGRAVRCPPGGTRHGHTNLKSWSGNWRQQTGDRELGRRQGTGNYLVVERVFRWRRRKMKKSGNLEWKRKLTTNSVPPGVTIGGDWLFLQSAVVRLQHPLGHLYQRALLLEPGLLPSSFTPFSTSAPGVPGVFGRGCVLLLICVSAGRGRGRRRGREGAAPVYWRNVLERS